MMFRKAGIGLLLALLTTTALAAGKSVIPKQAEMSMLVTGTVRVEPDGSVSGWEIDQREKLPDFVVGLIEKSAPVWRFEPVLVDGRPRRAEARMSLRVVANPVEDGAYRVAIRSGYFGEQAMSQEHPAPAGAKKEVALIRKDPPRYPLDAAKVGAQGVVYLVVKVGRSGAVEDVVAERIDLRTIGTERQMEWMRETLRKPAMIAARKWAFRVPAAEDASQAFWSVRVPVDYALSDKDGSTPARSQYGQWEILIPGPQQDIPWISQRAEAGESPEALVAGQVYEVGKGLKLLTPLQG